MVTRMKSSEYNACLKEMYALRRFGIKLGLDVIDNMLAGLDHPEKRFSCIHIAGTNGKGSIASMLSSVLHAAGYRTGLYTSPHLIRFNERICIDNTPVPDAEVVDAFEAVKGIYSGDREPTFFEYTTAMALYLFGKAKVDWAVIETGMGGRLDATNIITPAISVITNISIEHQTYLGNTIAQVTSEKAGIIKPGIPVITGVRQSSAIDVIRHTAAEKSAPLFRLGEDFRVRRNGHDAFTYYGMRHTWPDMKNPLPGKHQVENAAIALATCETLTSLGKTIPMEAIRTGLSKVRWPGRLEIIPGSPTLVIDGAHNLNAARRLADFLEDYASNRKLTLVIGILDDKPYERMLKTLVPLAERVILTRPRIDRSLAPESLLAVARSLTPRVDIIEDVGDAVAAAERDASPEDIVCVAGSLYVVGEAKAKIERYPAYENPV